MESFTSTVIPPLVGDTTTWLTSPPATEGLVVIADPEYETPVTMKLKMVPPWVKTAPPVERAPVRSALRKVSVTVEPEIPTSMEEVGTGGVVAVDAGTVVVVVGGAGAVDLGLGAWRIAVVDVVWCAADPAPDEHPALIPARAAKAIAVQRGLGRRRPSSGDERRPAAPVGTPAAPLPLAVALTMPSVSSPRRHGGQYPVTNSNVL
jgi:hypothetical protein